MSTPDSPEPLIEGIAIIGMAGRFPGASSIAEFWQNQLTGVESITRLRVEDLQVRDAAGLAKQSNYVAARAILKDIDQFDAEFFGILPKEAELMDPQQRVFLECCWEALENAGYDPRGCPRSVGVFAGSSFSNYFLANLSTQPGFLEQFTANYQIGNYAAMMGNSPDFLATRVSYKLNLRGPSFTMQSACSTSLVSVCQACQSLLTYQCDMALAGGVSIPLPQSRGYLHQDGGMGSSDGHCRTFDADAQGTVFGSGAGVVLLKRLDDAIADGDSICAVIRGFAVNNDGAAKVGYTAPSVEGQADVIAMAQEAAGVDPSTIGYIEAHGTATPLGDPIELAALNKAFRARTAAKQFCAIGTVKTNVGHLDVAAGITGLIHAVHVVREGKLPPTLHFRKPTPGFDLGNSPFYVNTALAEWPANGHPRRAGVSAFGVGGTNAHIILEQPPAQITKTPASAPHLLVLAARSAQALDAMSDRMAAHLKHNLSTNLADAAFTLQTGRHAFEYRRMLIAETAEDAAKALRSRDARRIFSRRVHANEPPGVCFLFPGQGSQQPNMGRQLYDSEEVFRVEVNRCAELLRPHLGLDLTEALYPAGGVTDESRDRVTQTILAQPAIFTVEYALAKLWMSWGIQPRFMLGHSIGEFVAACVAGVFSLEDGLRLIAARGRLMQQLPHGAMLSVRAAHTAIVDLIDDQLSIAAVNSPSLCVVSGPIPAITQLDETLQRREILCRRLHTSHAFHSPMMDPILDPFIAEVKKIPLHEPTIPYLSCVTGDWITAAQATDPAYWAKHFRQPVQFSSGVSKLRERDDIALLEVGPGNVLATLARQHPAKFSDQVVVSSLSNGNPDTSERAAVEEALGWLWLAGTQPDWAARHSSAKCRRIPLPTYPFERKRFWFQPQPSGSHETAIVEHPLEPAVSLQAASAPSPLQETSIMNQPLVPAVQTRRDKIRGALVTLFEDLSGIDLTSSDDSVTFLESGFDSLFLTQISQSLQSKFKVKVTFRQLMSDLATLGDLSHFIDEALPADAFAEATPAVVAPAAAPATQTISAPAPVATPVALTTGNGAAAGSVEQLMRDQLLAMNQLFAQQLAAVQGNHQTPPGTVSSSAATAVPQTALQPAAVPDRKVAEPVKELKGYSPFKPVQKSVSGELTSRQEKYIRDLCERYTRRTAGSKARTQEYRKVLADPRVVTGFRLQWKEMVYPIVTVRSEGSRLWDVDGNEYIDLLNGFGPILFGHRPSFIADAIAKQLHEGFEIGPQTLLAGEAAALLCEMTGNERATFCNTGSEAVLAALRLARTVTGRNKVVYFAGDYHGMFDEVLMKGLKSGDEPRSVPTAPGITREQAANVVVLEYGADESLAWIQKHAQELAAVLVEPVQSRHPGLQPAGFLKEIRRITEQSDTCLIFDEVVTGFRAHPGGCQALFNIRADLATYGKVLGGGMPIGVLAGKSKYMDALDGGMWQYGDDSYPEVGVTFFAGTFVRHPLAMAACAAMLRHLKEEGPSLQQRLSERMAGLVERLNRVLEEGQVPAHIEAFASLFYLSFSSEFRFSSLFYFHMREKGIHLLEGFPCFLTTAHSDADLDSIVRAFTESVAEMQAGGVLSETASRTPQVQTEEAPVSVLASSAPMTESQIEVLLSAQLGPEANCSYNESFSLHLRGPLNEAALRESLTDLVARHDALRTSFDFQTQTQSFAAPMPVDLPLIDLAGLDSEAQRRRYEEMVALDAREPFDLSHAPLLRTKLIRFEPACHVLMVTSHHAVCDGWSVNVLLDELSRLYRSRVTGQACDLDPLMTFCEYAKDQQSHFLGTEGEENEVFWMHQFEKLPPLLDLPVDRPRPPVKSFDGATYRRKIGAASYKAIKHAGAQQKCTLFVTLLAGFQALLHRLTGQDDLVVGIPAAGQSLIEDRALVGHCVNFLPLRGNLAGDPTASQFLQQVRQTTFDAYDHQNYTYGRLVRKLAVPRDPSRLPLIEVQFNLEKVGAGLEFPGLVAEVDPNPKAFVNFDLFLNAVEESDGLLIDLDYNTSLFDEATISRWLDCYETLLLGMTADLSQPVSRLPLLNEQERQRVLIEANQTAASFPAGKGVHQLIEEQAAQTPESIALVFENQTLTYEQLNARVNQLARHLIRVGVQPGDLIGVYMERSAEMIIALLAVWKAAAAYVPLDPTFPRERLAFVFEDTHLPVVLTQAKQLRDLPSVDGQIVCVDRDWPAIEKEEAQNLDLAHDPARVAYTIYTSGSTGRPKGVEVTHSNVVNLLCSMAKKPGCTRDDILVAVTTISFDIAALELYLPLITGAKLVLASRPVASDGLQLLDLLTRSKATIMQATPITFRLLLEAGWKGQPAFTALCGGEALPRELANQILNCGVPLWNMYGPTETTIWSSAERVTAGEGPVPLGPPIDNTRFYVLDTHLQPVPTGVAGELCIGGDGVARGYYKRPELTSEKFLPDPFVPGARIYRTGDLVRRRTDGRFEFLGRMDGQIKLRGFRIELGEIESVLAAHPSVAQATVALREDVPGDKRLIAYMVSKNGNAPDGAALRSFMLVKLPDYMVPAAFIPLTSLPLTPNGKIDRKALPAPDWSAQARRNPFVAPSTEEEKTMAGIWAEVLRLKQVGIHDNLFELGGDSLSVFQITLRAAKAGLAVTPRMLLQQRTIAAVLAAMSNNGTAAKPQMPAIQPVARKKYTAAHGADSK